MKYIINGLILLLSIITSCYTMESSLKGRYLSHLTTQAYSNFSALFGDSVVSAIELSKNGPQKQLLKFSVCKKDGTECIQVKTKVEGDKFVGTVTNEITGTAAQQLLNKIN